MALTPYYEDAWVTIYCGDMLDLLPELPEEYADALITDPPFAFAGGISNGRGSQASDQFFSFWWQHVCQDLARVLKRTAEGFLWCDWQTAAIFKAGWSLKQQSYDVFRITQMLYHYREMPGQGQPFRNSVDLIAYLRGPKSTGHRISNTTHNFISRYWYYGKHAFHPSEKDPEICAQLIKWACDEESLVLDPFMGSGSSCLAAKMTGRRAIGIELEEAYCELAARRIDKWARRDMPQVVRVDPGQALLALNQTDAATWPDAPGGTPPPGEEKNHAEGG